MWIKKSIHEINRERKSRKLIYEKYILFILFSTTLFIYWRTGSISNFLELFEKDPEYTFYLFFVPFMFYLSYRNYVLHGNFFIERPRKICMACKNGMGGSDDGWGFKAYGKRKKAWYQIKACKTPMKCDIVYLCEVKWVSENDDENA